MKHKTLATALAALVAFPAFANDKPGEGVTVRPVIQPALEEMFQARIIFRALKDLGYTDAEPNEVIAQQAHLAVGTGKPIRCYTWRPYWVSGALVPGKDVEWLSVPYTSLPDGGTGVTEFEGKNLGFAVDNLRIVARNDFLAANPAAAKLFEVAEIDINDISAENKLIADGEDSSDAIDKHVADWITGNQATCDGWLAEARKAAE